MGLHSFILALAFFVIQRVGGTLTPSGSVSIDCGGQQTFTCAVTGLAGWAITGLTGISSAIGSTPAIVAANARVTTPNLAQAPTSTITITGFNTNDNGGTVQCVDISTTPTVEGVATIAVVSTTLASATAVMATVDQCSATLTWSEPSDSSATSSVNCIPPSPQCSSCTSSGCTIGGLPCSISYRFTVTRSISGCGTSTAVSSAVMSDGPPSCPANVASVAHDDNNAVTVTWSLPPTSPPVTSTTVTYCPTSSPNCGDSQVCTSPCTVTNLAPDTEYNFTVTAITSSNCGVLSCNGTTITAETACPVASASAILSGVIPSGVLILTNIISVVVAVLVTRHCDKNSSKGGSSSRREELYAQVEGKKVYEDINMTDSPAYGPTSAAPSEYI